MPAKRDVFSNCVRCGASFQQSGIGRMRRYCSDACKMKTHRNPTHTPRQSRRSTIKFDLATLHRVAGFFAAQGRYDGQAAIEHLARQLFVELDANAIESYRQQYGGLVQAGRNVTVGDSASVTK